MMTQQINVAWLDFGGVPLRNLEDRAFSVVPPSIRKKPGKNEERYRAHLAGRALLAHLISQRGLKRWVVPDPQFGYLSLYDEHQKKDLKWQVNISHTQTLATAALAPAPIGIDIESLTRDGQRVLTRVATDAELAWVEADEKENRAIRLWSGKEAFSKALGLGMKFGFKAFEIDFSGEAPFPGKTTLKGPLTVQVPALRSFSHQGWLISVCTEKALLKESLSLETLDFGK